MRALVYHEYGAPEDVLSLEDVARPDVGPGEVLVRVHASSLNLDDLEFVGGSPFVRVAGGMRRPKHAILGSDVAGRVEATGKGATRFRAGDEVFADLTEHGFGGFAEYVSVPERALMPKPRRMTFAEAAAVPSAAVRALQGLRGNGPIRPGQKVLVNGAGGGLGTFAVQLAKAYGAEVTGVDSTRKQELIRSLGADRAIDYTKEHLTRCGERFDLILDVAAYRSFGTLRANLDCERVLSPGGRYVIYMIGSSLPVRIFTAVFLRPWAKLAGTRRARVVLGTPNRTADVATITELIDAGKLRSAIDRRVGLGEVPEALRYVAEGRALGKVVVTVSSAG